MAISYQVSNVGSNFVTIRVWNMDGDYPYARKFNWTIYNETEEDYDYDFYDTTCPAYSSDYEYTFTGLSPNCDYSYSFIISSTQSGAALASGQGSFGTGGSGGGGGESSSSTYYYQCYNITTKSYITSQTSTTSSTITRPSLSGYTYSGYVYHNSFNNCINYYETHGFDGTGISCSQHSSSLPYVVFFYTGSPSYSSWQTPVLMASVSGSSHAATSSANCYNAGYVRYKTPSYVGKLIIETTSGSTNPDYYSYFATTTLSAASGTDRNASVTGYISSDDDGADIGYDTRITYFPCSASTYYYWYVNAAFSSSGTYSIPWKLNYYRQYTITYNANGGSGGPGSQAFYADNLDVKLSSTAPTRSGYEFLGWSTSSSATSPDYNANTTYTLSAKNYILYAVWVATYTITYDANGGIGAPSAQTKTYGTALILSSIIPTREGYEFLGWATSNTATSIEYSPGSSYTTNANVTLYAVWKKKGASIYYGINEAWIEAKGYCGKDSIWQEIIFSYGKDQKWKQ